MAQPALAFTLSSVRRALRGADWLTADRAAAYLRVLLALTIVLVVADVAIAIPRGGWDFSGKTLGTDFLCFWTAARLALTKGVASAYDPTLQHVFEQASFGGRDPGYYAFIYPPPTLLLCLPLGLMPYWIALPVWLGTTGATYLATIRALLGRIPLGLTAILAFPAVLLTLGHGQNAFLTTALFGLGVLALRRRPALAGAAFGLLVIKPHLALLVPVYLLASRQPRAFVAAAATLLASIGLSAVVLGPESWTAYLHLSGLVRTTLEQGLVEPEKMQSAFAAVRLWHGPLWLAYAAQGLSAAVAGGALAWLAWHRPDPRAGGAVLVAAALLATPYVLDYDLTLLAVPMAWIVAQARLDGFGPWEKSVLLSAFLLPLLARTIATTLALPLGPFVIGALFIVTWRRAWGTCLRESRHTSFRGREAEPGIGAQPG